MKNKLLILLGLVAVVVLTVCSVRAYDHYKAYMIKQNQAAQEVQAKAAKVESDRAAFEQAEKTRMKEACADGLKAYEQLTTALKAKVDKPNCDLEQIQ